MLLRGLKSIFEGKKQQLVDKEIERKIWEGGDIKREWKNF